jgi:hypothetical protein
VGNNSLGPAGLRALVVLELDGNLLRDEGALALAGSPYVEALRRLVPRSSGLSPECQQELRDRLGERLSLLTW